jgi:predicted Rdx family selenoprotein
MKRAYCTECEWTLKSGLTRDESDVNQSMIQHHIETGHCVKSGYDVKIVFSSDTPSTG